MRHAILMTIYKDVELVNRILNSYPAEFGVFLHIDKKSPIALSDINQRQNLYVIKKYKVNWGGYNHVKAMLLLLNEALSVGTYDYFHWVTGQDIPIAPNSFDERIHEGFSYLEVYKLSLYNYLQALFFVHNPKIRETTC